MTIFDIVCYASLLYIINSTHFSLNSNAAFQFLRRWYCHRSCSLQPMNH